MSKTFYFAVAASLIIVAAGVVASHSLASSLPAAPSSAGAAQPSTVEIPPDLAGELSPEALESLPEGFEALAAGAANLKTGTFEVSIDRHDGMCLAGSDLCDFGARIVREAPCLAAGDCPAYESWQRVMGQPGIRRAPESAIRAAAQQPVRAVPPRER